MRWIWEVFDGILEVFQNYFYCFSLVIPDCLGYVLGMFVGVSLNVFLYFPMIPAAFLITKFVCQVGARWAMMSRKYYA